LPDHSRRELGKTFDDNNSSGKISDPDLFVNARFTAFGVGDSKLVGTKQFSSWQAEAFYLFVEHLPTQPANSSLQRRAYPHPNQFPQCLWKPVERSKLFRISFTVG